MGSKQKILTGLVLLTLTLTIVACSSNSTNISAPIRATWIEPQVAVDIVSIPLSEVENRMMTHFKLATTDGDIAYMAYVVDGEIFVRANVCPPCRSIGFSLNDQTLICDTCRTTFKAKTGGGIVGACVDFPKAAVPYEISAGQLLMEGTDLLSAYQNTLNPGLP